MRIEVLSAPAWAGAVVAALEEQTTSAGLRICLATGSTPLPVYRMLGPHTLESATVFLLDEFGSLPPGHPARCETMLRHALLDRVPAREFDFPDVDAADLAAECRRYGQVIAGRGLDLAVLGLGLNGHLGLNEPGSTPHQPTRVVQLSESTRNGVRLRYGVEPAPTWGVTVGLAEILSAREIWLLVTGAAKQEVLAWVATEPVGERLPASFLMTHPNATLWADEAAAALL